MVYITIKSIKKTLGKFVEMQDLYIGLPLLFIFLILFSFTPFKLFSIGFLTLSLLLMIPISVSKKNRMYKVFILLFEYFKRKRNWVLTKENIERNGVINGTTKFIDRTKSRITKPKKTS